MEPKKLNSNSLSKFFSYEDQALSDTIKICSFYSCNYCQGRPKNFKIRKNKLQIHTKKPYNPEAPEKICKHKECKYCGKLLKLIEENRNDYYIQLALEQKEKEQSAIDIIEEEGANSNENIEDNKAQNIQEFENIIGKLD